jgi:hypothetical protein
VSVLSSISVHACDRCGIVSLVKHNECPVCSAEDSFCEVELLETISGLQLVKHPLQQEPHDA